MAKQLGISEDTVRLWERNRNSPRIGSIPKIVEFLGYFPAIADQTLGEKLRIYRKTRGLTQKAFARILGVDPSTLGKWEKGKGRSPQRIWDILKFSPN